MGAPLVTRAFRAFTEHAACPDGCGLEPVTNDRFAPHLQAGECAVIDPDDREPVQGEIYVVRISSPARECGYRLAFVQLKASTYQFVVYGPDGSSVVEPGIGWMMHFDAIVHRPKPLTTDELVDELRSGRMSLCDGPLRTDGMRSRIVGRVVGFVPAVDKGERK